MSQHLTSKELGLVISREYARLLRGKLDLKSEPGIGNTFTLTLPFSYDNPDASVPLRFPQEEPFAGSAGSESAEQHQTLTKTWEDDRSTITPADNVLLIIEGNAELARTMMKVGRKMGFKILLSLTGTEGLALTKQFIPGGILLELMLPDRNGMDILRKIKQTRELQHIPVHIMSGKQRDEGYRQAGAIGYYQKPVTEIDIQHAIEHISATLEKSPKHLLIVEDDTSQHIALQELFTRYESLEITALASEQEAVAALAHDKYDAAIIDLDLKEGSGYGVCQHIKTQQLAVPVIIYTARDLTEEEAQELSSYAESIIIKTAQSQERLLDEVAMFLHIRLPGHSQPSHSADPAASSGLPSPSGSLEDQKILIIDNDIKQVFMLASTLENYGVHVIEASTGEAGIDMLHEDKQVNLLLINVSTSTFDGYAIIRQIRHDADLKHLPIIAITSSSLKEERHKCIQAGANDYVTRPIEQNSLIRSILSWIVQGIMPDE